MSNSFNVVLTGELLKGQSIMQAANSLSKLFKIAPIQAQQMLARAPLVIKKNLEQDTAVRFVQAMYKSGFGAAVEEQRPTKTAFTHPFNSHYDDEDEEEAAVTRITPVLVEQSRLEESLDTELTIPVAAVAPSVQPPVVAVTSQVQRLEPVALVDAASSASELSPAPPEAPPIAAPEQTAVPEHFLAEEIDAATAPVADGEDQAAELSAVDATDDLVQDNWEDEGIESIVVTHIEPLEYAAPQSEQVQEPQADEPRLDELAEETHGTAAIALPDPFAKWDETSLQLEHSLADHPAEAVEQAYLVEEIATESVDPIAETQAALYADEGVAEPIPAAEVFAPVEAEAHRSADLPADTGELSSHAADETAEVEIVAEPFSAIEGTFDADVFEPAPALAEVAVEAAEAADEAIPTAEVHLSEEQLGEVESDAEFVADIQVTDIQVAEVQWLEPVAQWQTVAELAEDLTQEQGVAASYDTAEQPAPAEAMAEQGAWDGKTAGAPPADFTPHPAPFAEIDEPLLEEPAQARWDEAVEISPALTERLAQIAEASKEITEASALNEADSEDAQLEDNDTAEGVLLFEEADVTEISSASWDDWHASDAMTASGAAAFNPLLDFEQVVPDWQNSSLELLFDTPQDSHQGGVTAANEQELAAFLDAPADYQDEPQAFAPEAVEDNTDLVGADELTPADALVPEYADAQEQSHAAASASNTGSAWAHDISVQANCGFLEVVIPKGKELHVAAAASVTMGLSLHEQLNAGSNVRAWLLAKGFVINTYEAIESAGNLGITAITHGMVCTIDASDFPVMVQQSAYLASTDDVQLNADQSRLNPVASASKWIHCSGTGELWLNAQGLWEMVEVDGCYRINSRYLMAYSKSLELKAPPLAGLKSYLTSGSGVECRLTGRGVVWVQTEASRAPVIWQ